MLVTSVLNINCSDSLINRKHYEFSSHRTIIKSVYNYEKKLPQLKVIIM